MAALPFHGAGTRSKGEPEPMDSLVAHASLASHTWKWSFDESFCCPVGSMTHPYTEQHLPVTLLSAIATVVEERWSGKKWWGEKDSQWYSMTMQEEKQCWGDRQNIFKWSWTSSELVWLEMANRFYSTCTLNGDGFLGYCLRKDSELVSVLNGQKWRRLRQGPKQRGRSMCWPAIIYTAHLNAESHSVYSCYLHWAFLFPIHQVHTFIDSNIILNGYLINICWIFTWKKHRTIGWFTCLGTKKSLGKLNFGSISLTYSLEYLWILG